MKCAWSELLAVLPSWLRRQVDVPGRDSLQEIRMRTGEAPTLLWQWGRRTAGQAVTEADLHYVINMACRYSPWTVASAARGFITISGGHRIGLCGDMLQRGGKMAGLGQITSLNIRVCRAWEGISGELGALPGSVLLLGPPGSGKTTLLRDLVRVRSRWENVAVVDERGEIFPSAAGFDRGKNTDVVAFSSKQEGLEMMLRLMSPQCIAVDEITAGADCHALVQAGRCGVSLLATAHASSVEDLGKRPVYSLLVESGLFDHVVVLRADKSWRLERMVHG